MSISRDHGKVVFTCDLCDDTFETEEKDFDTALTILKENDEWLITKEGQTWMHICPECIVG